MDPITVLLPEFGRIIKGKGNEIFFYGEHKFTKHSKYLYKQRWQCTRRSTQLCSAAVSTIDVNGVTMMKVLAAEHSHYYAAI